MDPNLWDDPDNFDPSRFLKNGKVTRPDYFIPFSVGKLFCLHNSDSSLTTFDTLVGRRTCLGDVLTKMEFFLFLSTLIQRFELHVPPKHEMPTVTGTIAASIVPQPFFVSLIQRPTSGHSNIE